MWQALKTLGKVITWHGWDWIHSVWTDTEGDARILNAEYHFGRLVEILTKRQKYDQAVIKVWESAYRKPFL